MFMKYIRKITVAKKEVLKRENLYRTQICAIFVGKDKTMLQGEKDKQESQTRGTKGLFSLGPLLDI